MKGAKPERRNHLEARLGDIVELEVDAIVNAANSALQPGGGVSGWIHMAAGPELVKECRQLGILPKGQAVITGAYNIPIRHIIHTVGPVYEQENGEEEELLSQCYYNSLVLADDNNIRSIAFPAISTGIFRYPFEEAAKIAIRACSQYFNDHPKSTINKVIFILRTPQDYQKYLDIIGESSD